MQNKQQFKFKKLFILKDQLFADIDDQCLIVAEARPTQIGSPMPSLVTAANRYSAQIDRWIDKYLNLAHSRMAAYVVGVERKAVSNIHMNWDEVEIEFKFPLNWEDVTFPQLADAVHDYIVNKVLYELFVLTLTSKDPVTQDKIVLAEDASSMIKHCLSTRKSGTEEKRLQPFG